MTPDTYKWNEIAALRDDTRLFVDYSEYVRLAQQLAEAQRENEELRNAIDQEMVITHLGVFNRGDDPVKAIKELMLWSQEVGEHFAKEELAALQASTEPVAAVTPKAGITYPPRVAVIKRNESGQITMQAPDGNHFDMSKYVGATLYTTPPTTTALLGSLGDWVYERMQQADSDYHNYGDDTAEVYATLKMVLSKIESMMIESLPLIEGEK